MGGQIINVNISPAGNVTIDAQGFTGNNCAKATEQLELVLGGGGKRTKKPEFHAPSSQSTNNRLQF